MTRFAQARFSRGAASSLMAEGKSQEAIAAYQRVISAFPGDVAATRARIAKARLHETLKQPQLAVALYEQITRSESPALANDAMMRKALKHITC